jgi:putative tryptophan/tyrosine transport system substrate-binding protein
MKRRDIITLLGGAFVAWPLVARAQQPTKPVIGFLGSTTPDTYVGRIRAFRQGLSETGYVEGRNAAVEYRWAEGQYNRLPAIAADLVRSQVSVIVASAIPAALAAKAATATIPVVFYVGIDPVELGLVASLSRPGGNLTGVVSLAVELGPKRLELAHELMPTSATVAFLVNPNRSSAEDETKIMQAARRIVAPTRATGDLPISRVCRRRRPDELWSKCYRHVPSGRRIYRSDSQGRKTGGVADRAINES